MNFYRVYIDILRVHHRHQQGAAPQQLVLVPAPVVEAALEKS